MGTRSLTVFIEESGKEICVMYRQFDGYPEGHGLELATFLSGMKLVNGYSPLENKENIFNRMGCLTASVIAEFKDEVGNFYIYPSGSRDCGEEYIYYVSGEEGKEPKITIEDVYKKDIIFNGSASDCVTFIENEME